MRWSTNSAMHTGRSRSGGRIHPARAILPWVVASALTCVPALLVAQETPESGPRAEIRGVVASFHEALAAADTAGALRSLHPDVSIYESGHAEDLAEYRGGHLASDIAFAAAVERTVVAEEVVVSGDAALYTSRTHAVGTWREREIDSHGTETMVLLRTADGWLIRHIHWSSRR